MNKTTIQFFTDDKKKIKQLCNVLSKEYGYRVGYRVAVMIAVNKLLKGSE